MTDDTRVRENMHGISSEQKSQMEDIISRIDCPKHFQCYLSGLERLCKVEPLGETGLIECFGQNRPPCTLGLHFGYGVFCKCPLRHYISRTFGI